MYTATSAPGVATYGQGSGPILLDDLACTGTETRLVDCPHSGISTHNCAHSEDAGAVCQRECLLYILLIFCRIKRHWTIQACRHSVCTCVCVCVPILTCL